MNITKTETLQLGSTTGQKLYYTGGLFILSMEIQQYLLHM